MHVHNVVDFTFAGPGHELVGHRYEIYISQIAMNLFPLMLEKSKGVIENGQTRDTGNIDDKTQNKNHSTKN
jgi:hypothetical protein